MHLKWPLKTKLLWTWKWSYLNFTQRWNEPLFIYRQCVICGQVACLMFSPVSSERNPCWVPLFLYQVIKTSLLTFTNRKLVWKSWSTAFVQSIIENNNNYKSNLPHSSGRGRSLIVHIKESLPLCAHSKPSKVRLSTSSTSPRTGENSAKCWIQLFNLNMLYEKVNYSYCGPVRCTHRFRISHIRILIICYML